MKRVFCIALSVAWLSACGGGESERPWPDDLPENPEDGQHFDGKSDPYYEGWYHKVVLEEQNEAFFFIYTVVNPLPGSEYPSEAFVYCGRSSTLETVYQSFPAEEYSAAEDFRDVRIGEESRATALRFAGRAAEGDDECAWDIWLEEGRHWPETMGWLTGQEDLETSWTVGTMHARAEGWVKFKGERIAFEDASGYCDHNWGVIFPEEWIWLQANSFPGSGAALAASGGTVDFGESQIEAFMIGLMLDGEVDAFRTQDLDTIDSQAEKGSWHVTGQDETRRISIEASCDQASMFDLLVPTPQGMRPRAWESLNGTLEVTLESRPGEGQPFETVYSGVSPFAGVEIGH